MNSVYLIYLMLPLEDNHKILVSGSFDKAKAESELAKLLEFVKLKGFKYFCDFDLTNVFHQFKLDEKTSELLSIMTIAGPIRPLFMPEGISPASAILQTPCHLPISCGKPHGKKDAP